MDTKFEFEAFCKGVEGILDIKEKVLNDPACTRDWRNRLQALKDNPLRIVVMGECKRGKSSFVNALLGFKDLVPVATDIATSTVFRIHYGEKVSYKVWFIEDAQREPLVVPFEELSQYGTEDGNPNNEKGVASIEVTCPSPLLENQVEIVDTPGLGGLFKNHKAITYQYVPFADAVFVVTDSDGSPIGQPELDLLKDLKEVTQNIYFVQTKSRLVDEDVREARRRNNVEILVGQASFEAENLKYFVVDSNRKFDADKSGDAKALKRSGFDTVLCFMDTEVGPKARLLSAKRFMKAFSYEWGDVQDLLARKKRHVSVTSPAETTSYESELKKAMSDFQEWQMKVLPARRFAFDKRAIEIEKAATDKIDEFSISGGYGQSLNKRLFATKKKKELESLANEMLGEVINEYARLSYQVNTEVTKSFRGALEDLFEGTETPVSLAETDERAVVSAEKISKEMKNHEKYAKPKYQNQFDRIATSLAQGGYRGTIVAGFAGGALGGVLGAVLGGLALGPAGVVTGAVAGMKGGATAGALYVGGAAGLTCATRAFVAMGNKELTAGQQFYWQQIGVDISRLNKQLSSTYVTFIRRFRVEINFAIDQGVKGYKTRMEQMILDLKRKFARTSQENALEKAALVKLEQAFETNSVLLKIG